jgi:hypothetical protein
MVTASGRVGLMRALNQELQPLVDELFFCPEAQDDIPRRIDLCQRILALVDRHASPGQEDAHVENRDGGEGGINPFIYRGLRASIYPRKFSVLQLKGVYARLQKSPKICV